MLCVKIVMVATNIKVLVCIETVIRVTVRTEWCATPTVKSMEHRRLRLRKHPIFNGFLYTNVIGWRV